jgi:hypothetical protein
LVEGVELADVKESEVSFQTAYDVASVAGAEVEVHDGETLREALHQGEKTW